MDDLYAVNAAKSEFREGLNRGDTSRVLAIADPDLINFSDGQPSEFGKSGLDALKNRLANLFERFTVKLVVIVIEIRLQGDVAYDYGWHDLMLTPKDGGEPIHRAGIKKAPIGGAWAKNRPAFSVPQTNEKSGVHKRISQSSLKNVSGYLVKTATCGFCPNDFFHRVDAFLAWGHALRKAKWGGGDACKLCAAGVCCRGLRAEGEIAWKLWREWIWAGRRLITR